jgi:hypothetical protein
MSTERKANHRPSYTEAAPAFKRSAQPGLLHLRAAARIDRFGVSRKEENRPEGEALERKQDGIGELLQQLHRLFPIALGSDRLERASPVRRRA